ncbi:hypothetical protein T4B_2505 [Trichinella pseudospiralis]|uniref:Uncharacterized protein n=1 Tax=Trichinella pseudospiralis TaxID=6337 RepID=A0A0V1JHP7_TRIPS|nr:hypothetical protein T4B_2505 [Trichinella pseudospiralis]
MNCAQLLGVDVCTTMAVWHDETLGVNEASRKAISYTAIFVLSVERNSIKIEKILGFYTCFSNVEYSIPPKSNVHFNYDIL